MAVFRRQKLGGVPVMPLDHESRGWAQELQVELAQEYRILISGKAEVYGVPVRVMNHKQAVGKAMFSCDGLKEKVRGIQIRKRPGFDNRKAAVMQG